MSRSIQQTHEWWKDSLGENERRERLAALRAVRHFEYAAAWRRNFVRVGVLVAIPVLVRLVATL
ncbi:hypothetical protein ACSFA3_10020 [Variovorax sp. RHLX14]|uniref:hypothetical protein n=1 Tax=Variovorax sp. RHLX14 TaxID=1259731 RepID=UPI003F453C2C